MLMWIAGLQKVPLGRLLGPKFGDLGVQFGDLGAQIEMPEGPLGAVLATQKPFVASWDIWSSLRGLLEPSWRRLGANKSKIPIRKVGLDSPSQSNFPSRNFGAPLAHPFRNFDAPWLPKDCLIQPSLPEFRSLLAPTGLSNPTFLIGISKPLASQRTVLSNPPHRNFV